MNWVEITGTHGAIAVSTRIRLARNLKGLPFGEKLSDRQAEDLIAKVEQAVAPAAGKGFTTHRMSALSGAEKAALYEKHLISREMLARRNAAVLLSRGEDISVMVGEEDHIRLQVLAGGMALKDCLEEAMRMDALLQESLYFAYSEQLGFLTQCPTNLGTGMRASVMLHLPMLTRTGRIDGIINAAGKIGLEVRGLYGEGSRAQGEFYQVSNSITLGLFETEICEKLQDAVESIIKEEEALRAEYRKESPEELADVVWRAAGTMRFARRLSEEETRSLLSDVRLGAACGILKGIPMETLNQLAFNISPAAIQLQAGKELSPQQRDIQRAAMIRRSMATLEEE